MKVTGRISLGPCPDCDESPGFHADDCPRALAADAGVPVEVLEARPVPGGVEVVATLPGHLRPAVTAGTLGVVSIDWGQD